MFLHFLKRLYARCLLIQFAWQNKLKTEVDLGLLAYQCQVIPVCNPIQVSLQCHTKPENFFQFFRLMYDSLVDAGSQPL